MNNIIKNQSTPTQVWGHRKTIQSQAAEIQTLRNKADALLHLTEIQGAKIEELNNYFEFKSICLSAALADLQRMDEKLSDAQDEFWNLGDACMNRLAGVTSPFQYE